tara:strand:+ start:863 stop:1318 length:456 start_codon:yes stop_codon:yes gene_type:complete
MEDRAQKDFLDESVSYTNKWKHFSIFSMVTTLLVIIVNVVGQNSSPGDLSMNLLNLFAVIEIPVLIIILIKTYKGQELLTFWEKLTFLLGILAVSFISTLIINWINPFDRNIDEQEFFQGTRRALIFSGLMIILCLPIIGFVKSKTVANNT